MPRGPNEKAITACELYKSGRKLIEIAKELGVPDGTVRRCREPVRLYQQRRDRPPDPEAVRHHDRHTVGQGRRHQGLDRPCLPGLNTARTKQHLPGALPRAGQVVEK